MKKLLERFWNFSNWIQSTSKSLIHLLLQQQMIFQKSGYNDFVKNFKKVGKIEVGKEIGSKSGSTAHKLQKAYRAITGKEITCSQIYALLLSGLFAEG